MTMTVSDIGSALLSLGDGASQSDALPLGEGHGVAWTLLNVSAGETWSSAPEAPQPLHLIVLEGVATCADGHGRQSVGSGHLVILDAESPLSLTNEEKTPFRAVIASRQGGPVGDET